nr:exocyst complex component 1 [Onthophagus taurus]
MSIRNILNKEVFESSEERVLALCHVGKLLKKKKSSILCVTTTINPPANISIVQVKQTDKTFKKKRTWSLVDLKSVDGKNEDQRFLEFDLQLDKMYRWVALNWQERQAFIVTIWRQANKYVLKDKPKFRNVPKTWLMEDILTPESNFVSSPLCLDPDMDLQDIQPITEKEQEDLTKLMSDCEYAISNAEAFTEYLARDLSLLESENVQRLLASEVETIMEQLDVAIEEAEKIEQRLDGYDEILCHVKNTMEEMEKKNSKIAIASRNNILLFNELEKIVGQLDLSSHHQKILENADFTTPEGIKAAISASNALKNALNADIEPALLDMAAVQEQKKKFLKLKDQFSVSLTRQLNNLFIHYGNHGKGETIRTGDNFSLPQHGAIHKELQLYTDLMHWTKVMDRKAYDYLRKSYTESFGKLYEKDLRRLFEIARESIGVVNNLTLPVKNVALLGSDIDWTLEASTKDRANFKVVLDKVLTQLEPVCLQEQLFCVNFFQLDILSPSSKNTQTTLDGREMEQTLMDKKVDKKIEEDLRKVMTSLFSCLEEELVNFVSCIEKQDSFYSMYVLVCLNQHVMSAKSTYLSNTFASVLIQVKRSLDKFMQLQIESIKECKIPRKAKSGILPYVLNLEEFSRNAEVLLKSDRRADLEKWYTRLIDTIIECISLHSVENSKGPPQVIKMENYHHLYSMLSQMKISVLDVQRKEAKQKYNDSLTGYVTLYFGKPLEKLNTFFDGVQARVQSGVKMSEVSYQLAFSKQELRKVISQYPGLTVKRGLEALYKKVEKHLSEESNLLPVVWRAMQEEFIQQHKMLEDLIQQCYPGSMISLEFTIDDILNFFSDIARSH